MSIQRIHSKKLDAACLILAGGQGKRLSPDKPLLKIGGTPIIERVARVVGSLFEEVVVVTNTPDKYRFLGLALVADDRPGCGPLMGIYSGLRRIESEAAFVCAADMPFLNEALIRAEYEAMVLFDIVVPWPKKRPQFLHSFYRKRCLPAIRERLEAEDYKIESVMQRCKTLRLGMDWFTRHGLARDIDTAFTNINTAEDYDRWVGREKNPPPEKSPPSISPKEDPGSGALHSISADVLQEIRRTLVEQETAYHQNEGIETYSSLWAHSSRVGRIARRIAASEGWDPEPAHLAGLLHDIGKFAHGIYHENDTPEEEHAARFVERILSGTAYEKWVSAVNEAILSTYLEAEATSDLGRIVYDADSLDKLGNIGVVQFFVKRALRRQFLDDDVIIWAGVELTYARHAPDTLKTATGRALARERSVRTRLFYTELIEEWKQLGLGAFTILEEEIAGIACIFLVPSACSCGGSLSVESDIQDAVKCRSVVATYRCANCGVQSEFSFCMPNVKGLAHRDTEE
jgi:putative nucleotidyltransferase with HDIG domain